jgi:mevalonate kinase
MPSNSVNTSTNLSIHATAPSKLILCGEHAVVYRRPAIALPVASIRAYAEAVSLPPESGLHFQAPDLGREWAADRSSDEPLTQVALATLQTLGQPIPDLQLRLRSDIPLASGMGSGAAIATVIVRALASASGQMLSDQQVAQLVFESEKRYHGTPSGIDNTVVAFEQPIWFQRRDTPEQPQPPLIDPIRIAAPFTLVIGDTGIRSATHQPVGEVRRRWTQQQQRYEQLFDQITTCVEQVRLSLAEARLDQLGDLLNQNHALLQMIGVSSPELDCLVAAAQQAGAMGAKLSGAGWGGVMIALADPNDPQQIMAIQAALKQAGASRVFVTMVHATDQAVGILHDSSGQHG